MCGNRNIYLMGFMGTGKTKIGKSLAKRLSRPFLDTDDLIQKKAEMTIPEIFRTKGEAGFRQLEKAVIVDISKCSKTVISLGGGAVIDPDNWKFISQSGLTIGLSYPPEIILYRMEKKSDRPLLDEKEYGEKFKRIQALLKSRESYYRRADLLLHMNKEVSAVNVVETIIGYLKGQT